MLKKLSLLFLLILAISIVAQDVTLTDFPKDFQLYYRDNQDSSIVPVSGTVTVAGVDSVSLTLYKDGLLESRYVTSLIYSGDNALFSFSPKIHAELANYKFELRSASTIVASVDSVICGDVYIIEGQSNAVGNNTDWAAFTKNSWIRTYGSFGDSAATVADSNWHCANTKGLPLSTTLETRISGGWAQQVARNIIDSLNIPVCLINGAKSGSAIQVHFRDLSMSTYYGRLYYRIMNSGIKDGIKAFWWHQGESGDSLNYKDNMLGIFDAWKSDIPSIQNFYYFQIHPGCFTETYGCALREDQRVAHKERDNCYVMSTTNVPDHDGCHYFYTGYQVMGNRLYSMIARDFYNSNDTIDIAPPDILSAKFMDNKRKSAVLTFDQAVLLQDDSIGYSLKEAFCLGDQFLSLDSLKSDTANKQLLLYFANPVESLSVGYIPNKYFYKDNFTYEGPWLVNKKDVGALTFYRFPFNVDDSLDGLTVDSINGFSDDAELSRFAKTQIYAIASYSNGNVDTTWKGCSFKSLDTTIAQISVFGTLVGVKGGMAKVEISKRGLTDTLSINITDGIPDSLKISTNKKFVFAEETTYVAVSAFFSNNNGAYIKDLDSVIVWTSSDTSKAKVNEGMIILGSALGNVNIIANYLGVADTCEIVILKRPSILKRINFQSTSKEFRSGWEVEYPPANPYVYSSTLGRGWDSIPFTYMASNDYDTWGVDSLINPTVYLINTCVRPYNRTFNYRVEVPKGEYIIRYGLGANDDQSLTGYGVLFSLIFEGDTIAQKPKDSLNVVRMDTITVTSDSGLILGLLTGIGFLEIMSADEGIFTDAIDDGFFLEKDLTSGLDNANSKSNGFRNIALNISPNPFNPSCRINFVVPQKVDGRISIYNIYGKLVKTINKKSLNAGLHSVSWNGKDNNGKTLASGIFLCKLQLGKQSITKKLVLKK